MVVACETSMIEDIATCGGASPDREPLKVLIVDDDATNRLILRAMLVQDGHTVLMAEDGQRALESFDREQPDIVLMDVMMPGMDGYEATGHIKARSGERFVPVIFLTALNDQTALVKCITSGGDDFLTKPYKRPILRAKLEAMERVRRLYEVLKAQKDRLAYHHARLQQEQEVAQQVYSNIVHSGCLQAPHIQYVMSPMALFNGDMLLVAQTPAGGLHVMLGDFTGHGLPAALGAMPVSDIFYSMTARGYAIGDIAAEINQKLKTSLPLGIFCAACLLEFDSQYHTLLVWNGGLPDLLVYHQDGAGPRCLVSMHLPLGVAPHDRFDRGVEVINLQAGDRVYAYTDGVIEARNPEGEMFGQQRLEAHLGCRRNPQGPFHEFQKSLAAFRAGNSQSDDITLFEITCDPALAGNNQLPDSAPRKNNPPGHWRNTLELQADSLKTADPLPQLMQMLLEFQGLHEHRECLYTILAELYTNALDHGVLRLNSAQKSSPEGFATYYTAREQRLATLQDGWIKIAIEHTPYGSGGRVVLRVEDSGRGFNYRNVQSQLTENRTYSGRGIPLMQSLCHELAYNENGTCATAVYLWEAE